MTDFYFADQLLLRIPYYPKSRSTEPLQNMLDDLAFRQAIFLASDIVYQEIASKNFQLASFSPKLRLTLARYQKRICSRPTPFGAFAAIMVIPWQSASEVPIVVGQNSFRTWVQPKEISLARSLREMFRLNPMLYPAGADFRLLVKNSEPPVFGISEFYGLETIKELQRLQPPLSRSCILKALDTFGHPLKMFEELLTSQLIVPCTVKEKGTVFPFESVPESPGSAFLACSTVEGRTGLSVNVQSDLRNALSCLYKIAPFNLSSLLKTFKGAFQKRFDCAPVPLMQALDPELGVAYPERVRNAAPASTWSPVHKLLLSKWTQSQNPGNAVIELTERDIEGLPVREVPNPPGCIVKFSLLDKGIVLSAAGGVSTLNTISRFTGFDAPTNSLAAELALTEQTHNPDVIFAEIMHDDGSRAENVSNRNAFFNYQILLSGPATVPPEYIIEPSGLCLFVQNGDLILWSKRHDKRVIPRFSCAYNFHLSTLPVFRFLCDLQYEGVRADFSFSMHALFPGLPFYPRLVYKGVVLSPASWHLSAAIIKQIAAMPSTAQFDAFRQLAVDLGLPVEVSYGQHDQLLHINTLVEADIVLLLKTIDFTSHIMLRECFPEQQHHVCDEEGNGFSHELVAFVLNKSATYKSPAAPAMSKPASPRFFPFLEWIYLKIYLHPAGYEELLTAFIVPCIDHMKADKLISSWFFVCYSEHGDHLRFRFKQRFRKEPAILQLLRDLQTALRASPNIINIEFATYNPENERYAAIGVDAAEKLFMQSSEMVVRLLHAGELAPDEALIAAVSHAYNVLLAAGFAGSAMHACAAHICSQTNSIDKRAADATFRRLKNELRMGVNALTAVEAGYLAEIGSITSPLTGDKKVITCADLIHMHLNRLFLRDQRKLEAETWYLLKKVISSLISYPFLSACS